MEKTKKSTFSGVTVEIPHGIFFKEFKKKVEEKIQAFKSSIIIKAKSSPDPFKFMQILWDEYAMPSLMYGIQPCPISRKGRTNLDLIQSKMVNSALDIPQNSQKVIALVATGFKPIWFHIYKSTIKFYFKIMNNRM